MDIEFFIIIITICIGFSILGILLRTWLQKSNNPTEDQKILIQWISSMQRSVDQTNKTLHEAMRGSTVDMTHALQENAKQLNERLDTAASVIGDLKEKLGEMSEVGKGIRSLQEFLQSPKLRGNIGEQVLSDMIGQTFPKKSFFLQYAFRSGMKVDAVLKTDAGLLCIDAKFPMENFSKMHKGDTETIRQAAKKDFVTDVKKHITDISKKYILPEEGTVDFALMYIPSESVYYELANQIELMEFARSLRVYPVSPNTLYAHLQVLLLSFQGKELEQQSQEIFRLLRAIQKDYGKIDDQLSLLGKHVTNAYNSVGSLSSSVATLGQKLSQTNILSDIATTKKPQ